MQSRDQKKMIHVVLVEQPHGAVIVHKACLTLPRAKEVSSDLYNGLDRPYIESIELDEQP